MTGRGCPWVLLITLLAPTGCGWLIGDKQLEAPACADPCPIAKGLDVPYAIAVDEANVYWTEAAAEGDVNGSVKACPVEGCGAGPVVYAQGQVAPKGIAVDAQNVYWGTATPSPGQNSGGIWSCAIGGCNGQPTQLAAADSPVGIAVDSSFVYWTEIAQTVKRVAKSGGSLQVLWDGGTSTPDRPNACQQCVVDTDFVYVNDNNAGVFRVPVGGGDLLSLYKDPDVPVGLFGLDVDAMQLYFGGGTAIRQMDKSATSGATALAPSVRHASGLKLDPAGGVLYFATIGNRDTGADGTVGKVSLDGGAPVLLHQSLLTPGAVAVNSKYLFWISNGTLQPTGFNDDNTGALYRTPK